MRSRARLIEVMKTVNRNVYPEACDLLWTAHYCVANDTVPCPECARSMRGIMRAHSSPHIRELATEALHYLEGGD